MLRIVFVSSVLICASGFPSFQQNSYTLIYEHTEVVDFNHEYFGDFKIKNFKHNRTQAASNVTVTLKKDVTSHLKIQVEAYKFMSNEYRTFPVLFSYSFCEGLLRDDFGMQAMFKCGNFTVSKVCPVLKKGSYNWCNFKPNDEKFPPHMPEGSYMIDIKWFHGTVETLFLQAYGTIKNKPIW